MGRSILPEAADFPPTTVFVVDAGGCSSMVVTNLGKASRSRLAATSFSGSPFPNDARSTMLPDPPSRSSLVAASIAHSICSSLARISSKHSPPAVMRVVSRMTAPTTAAAPRAPLMIRKPRNAVRRSPDSAAGMARKKLFPRTRL